MNEKARVFVALPVYGGYHAQFVPCLLQLVHNPPRNADFRVTHNPGDSLVSRSRNRLAAQFLASDATHLLFLDTDLIFSSEQIERLISHDKELVIGLYPKKQKELAWVCNMLEEHGPADPETGLQRILYGGTGCMLIARSVFEKIARMFPEIRYQPDDGEPAGEYHDFFKVGVCVANGRRRYLSEDWFFCEMAKQAGVECFADTRVVLKHVGEAVYPLVDPFDRQAEGGKGEAGEVPTDPNAAGAEEARLMAEELAAMERDYERNMGRPFPRARKKAKKKAKQPKAGGPEAPRSRGKKLRTTKHRDPRRPAR